MVSTTRFVDEKEYLLPRNIIFELISKNGNEYTVLAKPYKPDQFTIKTGCFSLNYYDIVPAKISTSMPRKQSTTSSIKVKKLIANLGKSKKNITPIKSKRCPNGMIRNKITNECVPKQNKKEQANIKVKLKAKLKAKLKRCPKGTRRNPNTLQCEDKK